MNWEFDFWNEELDFTIPKETFFFFPNLFSFASHVEIFPPKFKTLALHSRKDN